MTSGMLRRRRGARTAVAGTTAARTTATRTAVAGTAAACATVTCTTVAGAAICRCAACTGGGNVETALRRLGEGEGPGELDLHGHGDLAGGGITCVQEKLLTISKIALRRDHLKVGRKARIVPRRIGQSYEDRDISVLISGVD